MNHNASITSGNAQSSGAACPIINRNNKITEKS